MSESETLLDDIVGTSEKALNETRKLQLIPKLAENVLAARLVILLEEIHYNAATAGKLMHKQDFETHLSIVYRAFDAADETYAMLLRTLSQNVKAKLEMEVGKFINYLRQLLQRLANHIIELCGRWEALFILTVPFHQQAGYM